MKIISDFHMHTPLCGHAVGKPAEYAEQALNIGLAEIGFSDHAPFVHMVDPGVTMSRDQLSVYHRIITNVQKKYKNKLSIKFGIEADFIPGYEDKTREIIEALPYDYVIGSVHFIKDWGFDHPNQRDKWDEQDVNDVYRDYYELLRQSAQTGMYDIIAHCDLVKKFGHRASEDLKDELEKTAKVFKECGVVVEINTSGLRKPVKEMYPSLWNLEIYCQAGVPLTFGSDAHDPLDVGRDFDKAMTMAKEAGYKEYVLFAQRKIDRSIRL